MVERLATSQGGAGSSPAPRLEEKMIADNARKRYMYDAEFKNLVDSLLNLIKNCEFSPGCLAQEMRPDQ